MRRGYYHYFVVWYLGVCSNRFFRKQDKHVGESRPKSATAVPIISIVYPSIPPCESFCKCSFSIPFAPPAVCFFCFCFCCVFLPARGRFRSHFRLTSQGSIRKCRNSHVVMISALAWIDLPPISQFTPRRSRSRPPRFEAVWQGACSERARSCTGCR